MTKRIIVSCENEQELQDLISVVSCLKSLTPTKTYYIDIINIAGGETTTALECLPFDTIIRPNHKILFWYKSPSKIKKIIGVIALSIYFQRISNKTQAKSIITGVPLVFFRSLTFRRNRTIKLFSIIRSIILISNRNTSLSSYIYWFIKKLNLRRGVENFFIDYNADHLFCIGQSTKDFLIHRGINPKKITISGSLYCQRLSNLFYKTKTPAISNKKTIVFFTAAFLWHGDNKSHPYQLDLIKEIQQLIVEYNSNNKENIIIEFVLRKHPRDLSDYNSVESTSEKEYFFTNYPQDTLYLSVISTLSLELSSIGLNCLFISSPYFQNKYNEWYKIQNIKPISPQKLASNLPTLFSNYSYNIISPSAIDTQKTKSANLIIANTILNQIQ